MTRGDAAANCDDAPGAVQWTLGTQGGRGRSQVEVAAKLAQPSFCTRRDNTTLPCHSQCISFNSKIIYFSKNTILIISKGGFNQYIRALIHPHN